MSTDPDDKSLTGQGRLAGFVIAMSGALWAGAEYFGPQWGWSNRTLALVSLAAMGGFAFGLIVTFRVWRARQKDEG